MFYDILKSKAFNRSIFNAIVAPRPIGWISSMGLDGRINLAPFSHFNLVSTAPAVLIFSCNTPSDRPEKDTLANVRATGEFVYNMVTHDLVKAMNTTSTPVPYGVDEFELAGLEKADCVLVKAPRVKASPAAFECQVLQIVKIEPEAPGDTSSHVVFGRVVGMHIEYGYVNEAGRFDTARARPMTRLGGLEYSEAGDIFELPSVFKKVS